MSYRLKRAESVRNGIRRIAREQIDKTLAEIDARQVDPHETVHQVRKRCKKIRGLLRLVRPAAEELYQYENAVFRDAAGQLSYVRDAQALVETFDDLVQTYDDQIDSSRFASVRQALVARRERITRDDGMLEKQLSDFRHQMSEARVRIDAWSLDEKGFDALGKGLAKTYGRGRRAMHTAQAKPTPENFHQWRKRAKYHWYHLRILKPLWEEVLKKQRDEADRLGEILGDDHNLAVLAGILQQDPEPYGKRRDVQVLLAFIESRRAELQAQSRGVGERLYAEKEKHLVRRFRQYWTSWRRERRRDPKLAQTVPTAGQWSRK